MGNRTGESIRDRELYNQYGVSQYLQQREDNYGGGRGFRGKIGADYNFSKADILTYTFNIGRNKHVSNDESEYFV